MSTMMKACWHCGVPVHVENTGFHVCLVGDLKASVECLRAEREGLVRDAERYRWLQEASEADWRECSMLTKEETSQFIDAALDAARGAP